MKKYIIVNLETQEMFRTQEGVVRMFDDCDDAMRHCWMYELDNVYVCELIKYAGENKCKCGGKGAEPHTCPYDEDVNNDSVTMCNCCKECRDECAMDI